MKPIVSVLLYSLALILLTGCIPILIHAAVESDAQEKTAYSAYCDTQAKINSDRQLAGQPTNAVMTRAEWKATIRRDVPTTNQPPRLRQ